MNTLLNHVHLARPALLWALAALPLIALLWTWRRRRSSVWRQNVDAHLLPHLLVAGGRRAWSGLALLLLGPGAYSVDAVLFGRRVLERPASRRGSDDHTGTHPKE